MAIRKFLVFASLMTLVAVTAGCGLPIRATSTPFVFATPNLTTTALFNPTLAIPPTATPPAVKTATLSPGQAATATPVPTATGAAPTATPEAATATAVPPTATPTGPIQSTTGLYVSTPPNLNGDWSDWTAKEYPAKFVVFVNSQHPGSTSLQASYRVEWDATYLYLAVKVRDSTYVQNATGANLYKGDSVELLLDANLAADAGTTTLTQYDYQLGISPGTPTVGTNPEAYLWNPTSRAGSLTNVKIGATSSNGYYRVEAAIPWTTFGVTPSSGMTFGFALSVSDDDSAGTAIQERMVSSVPNRDFTDPSTWGVLTLSN